MTNQRGWKDGVYNPGFPPDKAYIERKAKEFAEAGITFPEIKGVVFKRSKNEHKPMRNVVTRVVMVGFDPFNHSGLPEHIEDRVVMDYWANEEQQFVLDWVNGAPEGEIRFGCLLNMYGKEDNYKPFPDLTIEEQRKVDEVDTYFDYAFRSDRVVENGIVKRDKHGPSGVPDEYAQRRKMIEGMGLPPHLVSAGPSPATLRIPKMNNEVRFNGVALSKIELPEHLERTRELVIEIVKETAEPDWPNLLTIFVSKGGNIRDLSEFTTIVKALPPQDDSLMRDLEGLRASQRLQQLADTTMHLDPAIDRNSVRGIFPLMVLEQTGPDLTGVESDNPLFRNSLCPEVQTHEGEFTTVDRDTHKVLGVDPGSEPSFSISLTSPYGKGAEGEFLPKVTGAYAVGADGVKRDLRDIDFMSVLLGPVEGDFIDGDAERELQKTGLYRPQGGIDVFKVAALAKRNTPIEGELVDKGVMVTVLGDEDGAWQAGKEEFSEVTILMSQQAIDRRMVRKEEIIFAFAGHTYKQTVFLSPEDVTGLCELYVPIGAVLTNEYGTRPNPIREHWEKHGDPYDGRIPHIQQFVDITKQTSQPNRSPWGRVPVIDHTSEGFLSLVDDRGNPVSKEEQLEYEQAILKAQEEELTPEEIADREQAIQEASEGKLDYLLEGTQWDPKNRNK